MFYKNARIFGSDFQFHHGAFEVKDGKFGTIIANDRAPGYAIDLEGATVIPGPKTWHLMINTLPCFRSVLLVTESDK